jgi:hypothetical protein
VLELAQEAVMDGNNLATIFCPRCGKPMKQLPSNPQKSSGSQRFYCHNDICSSRGNDLFYIDLPSEAIMDNNNLAAIFCPKCGGEMKAFHHKADAAVNF